MITRFHIPNVNVLSFFSRSTNQDRLNNIQTIPPRRTPQRVGALYLIKTLLAPSFENAIRKGSLSQVEKTIKRNEGNNSINQHFGPFSKTPLTYAVERYSVNKVSKDIISILINNGADLKGSDMNADTALIIASQKGLTDIVKLLLTYSDAGINERNSVGCDALYFAASSQKDYELTQLLLNNGASLCGVTARAQSYGLSDLPGILKPLKKDLETFKANCLKDENFNIEEALKKPKGENDGGKRLYLTESAVEIPEITQTAAYKNYAKAKFLRVTQDKIGAVRNNGPIPSNIIADILLLRDMESDMLASNLPNPLDL